MKRKLLSKFVGFGFIATTLSISVAFAGTCERISGVYGSSEAIVLGNDGKTLNVVIANGNRPNAYGTCIGDKVFVTFPDDSSCCTGTFDGNSIRWSNGSSWNKNNH